MSGPFGSSQWMYNSGGYEIPFSLRFDGADGSYLHKTPSASASTRVWTFATWIKRSTLGGGASTHFNILGISSENDPTAGFRFQADSLAYWDYGVGGTGYALNASTLETAKFRDPSAWAHVMIAVNTTHGTDTNRLKIYWNGVLQTLDNTNQSGQGNTYPDQNADTAINASEYVTWIGASNSYGSFDGYMADTYFINNQQLTPASFGETGDFGEFKPIEYTGTFDAYSSYLDYADSGNLGDDESGNGADWAEAGIVATDQMLDTPTNNFCTLNPLHHDREFAGIQNHTFSEGNLKVSTATNSGVSSDFVGTFGMTTGKWYWEFVDTGGSVDGAGGVTTYNGVSRMAYYGNGNKYNADGATSYGASFAEDDIIGVAFDADNQSLTFYKNNAGQGTISNAVVANDTYFPFGWDGSGSPFTIFNYNFGQDSTFAAHDTGSNGFSDSNGRGDFYYAPPSGFLALCTKNLPEPAVIPSEYFNAQIWSGDSSGDESFTTGFQPDLVWFLIRNLDASREMVDSLRGVTKVLSSDTDVNEFTEAEGLQSFDANGFSLGTNSGGYNRDSRNYLGFSWRAGGGAAAVGSNTDGSINTTDTSAAVEAGFSISTYTGTGATATVGHGLSKVPEIIFVKNRTDDDDWCVFFGDGTDFLRLNTTLALTDDADRWNDTAPTTSVFTVDTDNQVNGDGDTYVAYSFHSVEGHSKIGTYTGNGDANGVFVYLGFRPKFLMCKKTSGTESWWVVDTARKSFNPHVNGIELDATADELAVAKDLDLLANGFKSRKATGYHNDSATYMYMAFAETPFKYANSI